MGGRRRASPGLECVWLLIAARASACYRTGGGRSPGCAAAAPMRPRTAPPTNGKRPIIPDRTCRLDRVPQRSCRPRLGLPLPQASPLPTPLYPAPTLHPAHLAQEVADDREEKRLGVKHRVLLLVVELAETRLTGLAGVDASSETLAFCQAYTGDHQTPDARRCTPHAARHMPHAARHTAWAYGTGPWAHLRLLAQRRGVPLDGLCV